MLRFQRIMGRSRVEARFLHYIYDLYIKILVWGVRLFQPNNTTTATATMFETRSKFCSQDRQRKSGSELKCDTRHRHCFRYRSSSTDPEIHTIGVASTFKQNEQFDGVFLYQETPILPFASSFSLSSRSTI